jgi:tRNA threonylcarbamoyladenosine biosynthesis protein TsaE
MKIKLADAAATEALGAVIARILRQRTAAVIYLEGDLGAGKTTLARGLLRELGVEGPIRSPTYTLLEPYHVAGREVLHMDLYRLNDANELHNLGLADFPPDRCLWLVEWPQRGGDVLSKADVLIRLHHTSGRRQAEIEGFSVSELAEISL